MAGARLNLKTWHDAVNRLETDLLSEGLTWSITTDYPSFRDLASRAKEISGQFDAANFEFTHENWYGISVTDAHGNIASVVAGRLDRLGGLTLAEFWGSYDRPGQQGRLYTGGKLGWPHAPGATLIRDTPVGYCGDMYVEDEWRRRGLGSVVARLNHIVGFVQLGQPKWMYALISADLVGEGWQSAAGFSTHEPCGVMWDTDPEGASRTEYLVYNSAEQMVHWIDVTARGDIGFRLMKGPN